MKKHVIIVGAAKSGTSTLMDHMAKHENVNTSAGKEPRYFCNGYYEKYLKKGIKYENLWKDGKGDVCLEASTGYTKYPAVDGPPNNMKNYGISPKMIYIVRSPIDRMISHAKYMMWREKSINIDQLRESCVCSSKYYTQAKRYLSVFEKKNFKLIKLSEMSENTNRVIKDVFDFIEESPINNVKNDVKNETRNVTEFELRIRKIPLWKVKNVLPNWVKVRIRSFWSFFSEGPEKRVISGIKEEKIRDMCRDALRLEEIFSVNLNDWRKDIARSEILT
jgi:hypothetical protein